MTTETIKVAIVLYDTGPLGWAGTDVARAHDYARATGSVVVELPIAADYRTSERTDETDSTPSVPQEG